MIQPNNLRNRWRRYKQTRDAYGFVSSTFRDWAAYGMANPSSYSAQPGKLDEPVKLTAACGGLSIINPKRKRV